MLPQETFQLAASSLAIPWMPRGESLFPSDQMNWKRSRAENQSKDLLWTQKAEQKVLSSRQNI